MFLKLEIQEVKDIRISGTMLLQIYLMFYLSLVGSCLYENAILYQWYPFKLMVT